MNDTQRIIKYCALAFAFFIIFNIMYGIVYGISSITNIFDNSDEPELNLEELHISDTAAVLNMDLAATNLRIEHGDYLKVETNNKYVNVRQDNNQVYITERKHTSYSNKNNDLVIHVPDSMLFEIVSIETGAGKIDVSSLCANKLYLNLGAGKVTINNLNVYDEANIEGGVGKFEVMNGTINNLDLNLGVGETKLNVKLLGETDIEAGVGSVNLDLIGNSEDYRITVEKGIGSINIDGNSVKSETTYGTGINTIDIDGGIGSFDIDFN